MNYLSKAFKKFHFKSKNVGLFGLNIPLQLYTFVLFLSSLLGSGYAVYTTNQAIQIPFVYLLNNSALYPNDPFAATLPYYSSLLWHIVALGVRFIPLEPLFLTLFLLERLFVIYAAGYLARTFFPKSQLAVVGAMALFALGIGPILGSGTVVTFYFEQTGLSIPFFLLSVASFYSSQAILWAIWLAIGFNLNSMYGVYAITYFIGVFLFDSTYRSAWKKWLSCFGLFLLLGSPAIFLTLSAFGRNAHNNSLWMLAAQVRFPHHLYPLSWSKDAFAKFGLLIILLVGLLHQNRHKMPKLFKHSAIWAGISLLWLLYAFVAAYIAKSPSMQVMHPARATDLWYCFAGIALVSLLAVQIEESRGLQRRTFLVVAFSASILIWFPLISPSILAFCMLALMWQPIWYGILGKGSSKRLALLLTLFVLLVGLHRFRDRLAQTKSVQAALIARPSAAVEQVANWASANTSTDGVFLVSNLVSGEWDSFRALAKRPLFTTWKDGSAILWDRAFVQPWVERLNALGLDITQPGLTQDEVFAQLGSLHEKLRDEEVKQLQFRFPISYWVVPVERSSTFPIAFQNQSYKVLNLK
jgi:hypothetical protein